jgi:hypothetical protein
VTSEARERFRAVSFVAIAPLRHLSRVPSQRTLRRRPIRSSRTSRSGPCFNPCCRGTPKAPELLAGGRLPNRFGAAILDRRRDIEFWPALDALVLKASALVPAAHWVPVLSPRCCHLEGHGGAKAAVRFVDAQRAKNTFVFRTDVKRYYTSIDHDILLAILERHVPDGRVLDLLRQYVRRTIYGGGLYEDVERGISLGCPLSPLMGAFYLTLLDERMETTGLANSRFIDDWVILAPTRWKLRAAIRLVNETLAALNVEQHPDKTSTGRVSRCALTSWAICLRRRGCSSPRARWRVALNECPGLMSEVRT